MRFFRFWRTLCLITMMVLNVSLSVTVTFPNSEPLYITPGRTLVLEAQYQVNPSERIILKTWERKNTYGEVRVADGEHTYNERTFVEKNGALLRIKDVQDLDYGSYKITVTDSNGKQVYAQRDVLNITKPPQASLSMQCSVQSQGAQWDTTLFSWQVDGVPLSNQTGEISQDGSTVFLKSLGQNYTCSTESSQGTSKVDVQVREPTPEPEPDPYRCHCPSLHFLIAFVVIQLVIIGCLTGLCCWYKKKASKASPI